MKDTHRSISEYSARELVEMMGHEISSSRQMLDARKRETFAALRLCRYVGAIQPAKGCCEMKYGYARVSTQDQNLAL